MTTEEIIKTLIAQRDRLNKAIEALQGTAIGKRRGRPPAASAAASPPVRRKRTFTKAQREEQAERMRQYWASKRGAGRKKWKKAKQ